MASYTPNLNLIKPADADSYDIANDNGNMDKIDAAYGTLNSKITNKFDNTAIQTVDFNSIKDTCVIRTTGSSTNYPSEVASGSGILATFDGLSGSAVLQLFQFDNTRLFKRQYWYGTWSAWQELATNNKITFTLAVPSGWTFNNNGCYKVERIVCIIGSFATTNGTSEKTITFSNAIPSDFRPDIRVDFAGFNNSTDRVLHGIASNNGNIVFYRQETENITNISFSLTYIL